MYFKEVCQSNSSFTLASERDILAMLVYEEKYKLIYYTILDSVACQDLLNSFFLLNDDLGVTNLHCCI